MAIAEQEHESYRPDLWRFTKDQYYRLSEMGWFMDMKVELIDGVIIEKYSDTSSREPRSLPWTVVQYHQIADMNWLDEKRTELIHGDIIEMPPIGTRHMTAVMLETRSRRCLWRPVRGQCAECFPCWRSRRTTAGHCRAARLNP